MSEKLRTILIHSTILSAKIWSYFRKELPILATSALDSDAFLALFQWNLHQGRDFLNDGKKRSMKIFAFFSEELYLLPKPWMVVVAATAVSMNFGDSLNKVYALLFAAHCYHAGKNQTNIPLEKRNFDPILVKSLRK